MASELVSNWIFTCVTLIGSPQDMVQVSYSELTYELPKLDFNIMTTQGRLGTWKVS